MVPQKATGQEMKPKWGEEARTGEEGEGEERGDNRKAVKKKEAEGGGGRRLERDRGNGWTHRERPRKTHNEAETQIQRNGKTQTGTCAGAAEGGDNGEADQREASTHLGKEEKKLAGTAESPGGYRREDGCGPLSHVPSQPISHHWLAAALLAQTFSLVVSAREAGGVQRSVITL